MSEQTTVTVVRLLVAFAVGCIAGGWVTQSVGWPWAVQFGAVAAVTAIAALTFRRVGFP